MCVCVCIGSWEVEGAEVGQEVVDVAQLEQPEGEIAGAG